MVDVFKSKDVIVQEMLDDFESITGTKLGVYDLGYEEVIKMHTYAGAISSFYASLQEAANEIHPQSSSIEGLVKHLKSRELSDRIPSQFSYGKIKHTGLEGTTIPIGTRVKRKADGRIFEAIESKNIADTLEIEVSYISILKGQDNNIVELEQEFELVVPIPDIDSLCINTTSFVDARNIESQSEMLSRIEEHDKRENSGGNPVAYEKWAKEASAQVVTAKTYKHVRGVSTVDTVITSGTTDIDAAVENNLPVTRIPSEELIEIVQEYISFENPTTDDHQTFAPTEEEFDTSIYYELYDESLRFAIDIEMEKIWKKFVYKVIASQKIYPTDLEKLIDNRLSNLIKHRRVSDFTLDSFYLVPDRTLLIPGTLTLTGGEE
mgnify:CR=1 FL=1